MQNIAYYKERSAVDNIQRAIEKAKNLQSYNAILRLTEKRALERAKLVDSGQITGRLKGVPFVVKDNFLAFDGPTTASSKMLEYFETPIQAEAVERLEAEGAICIGKANLDAFAHGGSTENSAFGPTKNAIDQTKVAGGSSGGSAVSVALGIVPFALGSDTGGSIRQPASFNGVVGIKPTYGAVSRFGVVAMASSTDTIGCFATTASDTELVMSVMSGLDTKDSTSRVDFWDKADDFTKKKVGIIKQFMGDGVEPEVKQSVIQYSEKLKRLGYDIEEVDLPLIKHSLAVYYIVVPAEVASNMARYDGVRYGHRSTGAKTLDELYTFSRSEGLELENKRRILIGNFVLSSGFFDDYYLRAQKVRTLLIQEFQTAFQKYDLLLGPVSPTTAFGLGERVDDPIKMYLADILTTPASLTGFPAISVPNSVDDGGLPIGVQLISNYETDKALLGVASQAEAL